MRAEGKQKSFVIIEGNTIIHYTEGLVGKYGFLQPPQALRFFAQRRARNASDTRVTGDVAQGTMGRRKKRGDVRFLLPAFLCAHIFIERETSRF